MAKITISSILGSFASVVGLDNRFNQIQDEFNNKVLYRNNPGTEPNQMENDLDLNGNDLINVNSITLTGDKTIITEIVSGSPDNLEVVDNEDGTITISLANVITDDESSNWARSITGLGAASVTNDGNGNYVVSVTGTGGDVLSTGNNVFTGNNSFKGDIGVWNYVQAPDVTVPDNQSFETVWALTGTTDPRWYDVEVLAEVDLNVANQAFDAQFTASGNAYSGELEVINQTQNDVIARSIISSLSIGLSGQFTAITPPISSEFDRVFIRVKATCYVNAPGGQDLEFRVRSTSLGGAVLDTFDVKNTYIKYRPVEVNNIDFL